MFKFIIECLYFLAPAGFAILIPDIFGHFDWVKPLNKPIDFNKEYRGKRIFGDHKTFRGFIFGTIAAIIATYIQHKLSGRDPFDTYSIFNYSDLFKSLLLGGLMGFGALAGDSIKSFFKRQVNIAPGDSMFIFDQIDFIIGAFVFALPVARFPIKYFLGCLIIYFVIHIITTGIGVLTGVKKTWI